MLNPDRYEELKALIEQNGIDLEDSDIELYTDLFEIASTFVNGKLSTKELFEVYDFLSDLAQGKMLREAVYVPQKDRIKIQLRFMEKLPQTRGRLTEEEKERLAFCVFFSVFMAIYDEEQDRVVSGLKEFTSVENIEQLYQDEKARRPEFFYLAPVRDSSDSEEYGLDPDYPIMLTSVRMSYGYLDALYYKAQKVAYERKGAIQNSYDEIVDYYRVSVTEKGLLGPKTKEWFIYIHPYAAKPLVKPPKGFTLWSDHS